MTLNDLHCSFGDGGEWVFVAALYGSWDMGSSVVSLHSCTCAGSSSIHSCIPSFPLVFIPIFYFQLPDKEKKTKTKTKTNDKQLYWANSITEKSDNWLNTSIILVQNALKLLIALQLCEQIFLFLQNKQKYSAQEARLHWTIYHGAFRDSIFILKDLPL